MELDFSFMQHALPFLLKALPVTLFLTALVLLLSLAPAFLMAQKNRRQRVGRKGHCSLCVLYPRHAAGTADSSHVHPAPQPSECRLQSGRQLF